VCSPTPLNSPSSLNEVLGILPVLQVVFFSLDAPLGSWHVGGTLREADAVRAASLLECAYRRCLAFSAATPTASYPMLLSFCPQLSLLGFYHDTIGAFPVDVYKDPQLQSAGFSANVL